MDLSKWGLLNDADTRRPNMSTRRRIVFYEFDDYTRFLTIIQVEGALSDDEN